MNAITNQQPASTVLAIPASPGQSLARTASKPIIEAPSAPSSIQGILLQAPRTAVPVKITDSPTDYKGLGLSIGASLLVALVTSCIGIWVVRLQLDRQRKDAQDQQRANTKSQLRLDAYKGIQAALAKYSDVESPFVRIALMRAELVSAVEAAKQGGQLSVQARFRQFADTINAFQSSLCELVFCIERYESILPGFDIFKTAFSCAMHDIRQGRVAFDNVLLNWLPMDGVDAYGRPVLLNAKAVTQEAVNGFNQAASPLETAIQQASSWVFDLGVEAQNFSLAEYADQEVPRRKPTDPTFFTITVNPADRQELQKKFDATEYGRWRMASLAYALRHYAQPRSTLTVK